MILAVVLLLGAALVGTLVPAVLRRVPLSRVGPHLALSMWLAAMIAFCIFAASAVVTALWPGHAPAEGMAEVAVRCLARLQHAVGAPMQGAVAAVGGLVLLGFLARSVVLTRRHLVAQSSSYALHHDLLDPIARRDESAVPTMWLAHPVPLAYAVAGRPGFVVATDGLRDMLDPAELRAVLLHEATHLRERHHVVVGACGILRKVLPFVPLFRHAHVAALTLVELAADRVAVRATSVATVRSALCKVAAHPQQSPAGTLGLAHTALGARLAQLSAVDRAAPPRTSAAACAGAAALTLSAPVVLAAATVLAVSTVLCVR
ncbi:M56 family metallopeptidase [Rhodococcus aerolatus]